jgi:hypothetical protein
MLGFFSLFKVLLDNYVKMGSRGLVNEKVKREVVYLLHYEGNALKIAVIGEPPEVKEEQVMFTQISFEKLLSEELESYDAVFITENHLYEAAESQYANHYLQSSIPIFFIAANSHIPFTVKETQYDPTWSWSAGNDYAVGVLHAQKDNILKSWGYGLYNDKKSEAHIKEVYSRIFIMIDKLNPGLL